MKKIFIHLLILNLFTAYGICAGNDESNNIEKIKQNPGLYLNPQDTPFFSEDNPLTGMQAFTVIPPFFLKNPEIQKMIGKIVEKELGTIGKVIHLKDNDMRGFGAGNVLVILIGNVVGWDGNEMPISRISLQVETSVILSKTGITTFPVVWSINTFFQNSIDSNSEDKTPKATQKIVKEFVQNYKYANQKKPPIFYIYD